MGKAIVAAILIFTMSLPAWAQLSPFYPPNLSKKEKREYDVRLAEQSFEFSLMRNDTETLTRLLADECTITDYRGESRNKKEYLEYLRRGADNFVSYRAENVKVNISKKNMATVTGRAIIGESHIGKNVRIIGQFTRVYEKRRGVWLLINSRTVLERIDQ